jgi:uncharacterized protein YjdB
MPRGTVMALATVLLAAAVCGSCEKPLNLTGTGTSPSLLTVAPKAATLRINQTLDLTAVDLTTSGDTAAVAVTWSVTSGSMIDTSTSGGKHKGRYKAGADTGKVKVIATGHPGGQSDTAVVTVTPVPVWAVVVAPGSATVLVGQTAQLTATTLDSAGDTLTGRAVSWASNTPGVATVSSTGLVRGVAAGAAMVTATVEGKSASATITVTFVPVASVGVSPSSASLVVGQTAQLTATTKDSAGHTLTGRAVSWTSDATAVATVNANGLVTGVTAGAATITATSEGKSGTAAITVTTPPPPPPPPTGSCLTQTGSTITFRGLQTSGYDNGSVADNTKVDATTAQFQAAISVNIPIHIGGGSSLCWSGGQIVGRSPPNTIYDTMHDRYGMVVGTTGGAGAPNMRVEGLFIFDYGDGVSFDSQGDTNWSVKNVHVRYSRDDCIENDFLNSGTIDSSFFDGCYQGISSQSYYSPTQDGSNNLVVMQNSLMRLQDVDQPYSGPLPNGNPLWKWDVMGPQLALYNNVFRADSKSWESSSDGIRETMAPPAGKLVDCANNVMVWLGPGAFPYSFPLTFNGKTCFTIMTGQAGLDYWNNAVAQWNARHPTTLPDIGPPIVSMFSPGLTGSSTLAGTVSLTATAVDDWGVVGVQFALNGQNIGAEVTTDALTKFTLTWDSHGVANGTYTLTATARDAAGHTTTSAGVTVTVSN